MGANIIQSTPLIGALGERMKPDGTFASCYIAILLPLVSTEQYAWLVRHSDN